MSYSPQVVDVSFPILDLSKVFVAGASAGNLTGVKLFDMNGNQVFPSNADQSNIPITTTPQSISSLLGSSWTNVIVGISCSGSVNLNIYYNWVTGVLPLRTVLSGLPFQEGRLPLTVSPTKTVAVDPTSGIGQSIGLLHTGDDQTLPSGGSALSTGVALVQNISGTVDNQRAVGSDSSPGLGIVTGAQNSKFVPVQSIASTLTLGSTSISVPAITGVTNGVQWKAAVGGVIVFEPGSSNEESARIQSITGSGPYTVTFKTTITGTGTAKTHTGPFMCGFDLFNVLRDIVGENDGGQGKGYMPAVSVIYNGGAAQGTQNYERERGFQGEKAIFTFLTVSASAGASSITVSNALGLTAGTGIDIEDPVGGNERVFIREDYVPTWTGSGNQTIPLRTPLLYSHTLGGSSTTSAATALAATSILTANTTNLVNGQILVIDPGLPSMEITTVTSFVASTSITVPALKRVHASGATLYYGPVLDFDIFDIYGPQNNPLGCGAEEVEIAAMWDVVSKSPRLITTAAVDSKDPSNILATTGFVYDPINDVFMRKYNAQRTGDANLGANLDIMGICYFNGNGYDRARNTVTSNSSGPFLASATRTATTQTTTGVNYNWSGVNVILNITLASGTGGLQVNIQGQDSVTGNWFNLNPTPTAITATGLYTFEYGKGASGSARGAVAQSTAGFLPRNHRFQVTHLDGSSYTYSLGYDMIV